MIRMLLEEWNIGTEFYVSKKQGERFFRDISGKRLTRQELVAHQARSWFEEAHRLPPEHPGRKRTLEEWREWCDVEEVDSDME
jgi:hypothetical protein